MFFFKTRAQKRFCRCFCLYNTQICKVTLFWQIFKVDLFWQIFKVALFWQIFKLVLKVKYKQLFLLQCNQLFQADIINNFHQVTRWSRNWSTDFGTDRETWSTTVKFIDTNWSTHRFPSTKEGFWVDRQKSLPCKYSSHVPFPQISRQEI